MPDPLRGVGEQPLDDGLAEAARRAPVEAESAGHVVAVDEGLERAHRGEAIGVRRSLGMPGSGVRRGGFDGKAQKPAAHRHRVEDLLVGGRWVEDGLNRQVAVLGLGDDLGRVGEQIVSDVCCGMPAGPLDVSRGH